MAFHPDRGSNGLFYVFYTDSAGALTVERYRTSANPDVADAASGVRLLSVPHPLTNHNGGQLQIGSDGHLYVAFGDGGDQGDPECDAQKRDSLFGKLLRLDVRQNLDRPPYYGIPTGNPFGNEIWAIGLRNPWRFSFDRATGDLYLGDVGDSRFEEVNHLPAGTAGGTNFGWTVMEGTACYLRDPDCPRETPACGAAALRLPVHEYTHAGNDCSITGGYVYRGRSAPELAGRYLFGDYCSGDVRALSRNASGAWQVQPVVQTNFGLASFGEDASGELYVLAGSGVWRLTSDAAAAPMPATNAAQLVVLVAALGGVTLIVARRRRRRSS